MRTGRIPLVLATAVVLAACSGRESEVPAQASPGGAVRAETAVAELVQVPVVVAASGTAEAWRTSMPATKLMGRVEELLVREGDRVDAGQVVARIESADLEAALAQAHAALQMAEASLENATAQHARMRELHAQRTVTDKALEDATAAFRVATASREVARANVRAAEIALSYAEVASPIAGWVTERLIEAGDMAAPGRPLVTIQTLSRMKLAVDVPERVVAGLEEGDEVLTEVAGRSREATIDRIVRSGDPATRTFTVEMIVDNSDGAIRAGMFARAAFSQGTREALYVPLAALVERGQLTGVFALDGDHTARLRWVKVGGHEGEHVEVMSGLRPGDRYLLAPPPSVHDGTRVEPF